MKTSKHLHLPHVHFHINPIFRDIFAIAALGFLIATAGLSLLVMLISRS